MNIDKTVAKETKYIAAFTLVLSVLMNGIFLIVGEWDYKVLLGSVWGIIIAVGNFLVMGLFVQKAVTQEEKDARQTVKASQRLRFFGIIVLCIVGVLIPVFNAVAVLVPLLFPRVAIAFRPLVDKNFNKN